jgi:hypothetical protein
VCTHNFLRLSQIDPTDGNGIAGATFYSPGTTDIKVKGVAVGANGLLNIVVRTVHDRLCVAEEKV